ncbi:hypothetical protein MKW94_024205 [Papaver nudicaule]|uniref:TraB domain-containing protein n=1 Tax=Papaver nudicaule TaxID=74823 RepID=A0AA41VJ46_PAPNU|nr:hypothetical protein [Papaver nudicaule]
MLESTLTEKRHFKFHTKTEKQTKQRRKFKIEIRASFTFTNQKEEEEMSSIFSRLTRVSLVNSFTTRRRSFHYQHGIPGIPTDGKVVLLKNSCNGAQVHLVGTVHRTKETTETVKKVINYVRPDTIAIELCESRAMDFMEHPSADDNLYTLYLQSKRARGGLSIKVGVFIRNCLHLLRGEVMPSNSEFRVAMQEASRLGAGCFYIDQNYDVTSTAYFAFSLLGKEHGLIFSVSVYFQVMVQNIANLVNSSDSIYLFYKRVVEAFVEIKFEDITRSSVQKWSSSARGVCPEIVSFYFDFALELFLIISQCSCFHLPS